MSEEFSNAAKLIWLCFCAPRDKKAHIRPELRPKFLSTLGPNPPRKARPDLQLYARGPRMAGNCEENL